MTAAPRVTVLLCVYDGAAYLEGAVRSVLEQSFEDFELLAVDDGSTDATPEILSSFQDPRLRTVRQEHAGLTQALIRGLGEARGALVARQDADDLYLPGRLDRQVSYLAEHPEADVVGTGVSLTDGDGRRLKDYRLPERHEELVGMLLELRMPIATEMFRREAALRIGGYRGLFTKSQDYDLILRLSERGLLANVPEVLCVLRNRPGSDSLDESDDQLRYTLLSLASHLLRSGTGADPLETDSRRRFLAGFDQWYVRSPYPRIFSSRRTRTHARLEWAAGRPFRSLNRVAASLWTDPRWPLNRMGLVSDGEGVRRWALGEGRRLLEP